MGREENKHFKSIFYVKGTIVSAFVNITTSDTNNNPEKKVLLLSISYSWEDWDKQRLSELTKVTQLVKALILGLALYHQLSQFQGVEKWAGGENVGAMCRHFFLVLSWEEQYKTVALENGVMKVLLCFVLFFKGEGDLKRRIEGVDKERLKIRRQYSEPSFWRREEGLRWRAFDLRSE